METPGTILKREREARGLSIREISSITRIPLRSLQHIEDDRYDMFPAEVFTRGFLRNYARELHINSDDLLLSYNALRNQRGAVSSRTPDPLPSLLHPSPAQPQTLRRPKKNTSQPTSDTPSPSPISTSPISTSPISTSPISTSLISAARPILSRAEPSAASGASSGISSGSASATSAIDNQRTFRFAYLIVILVVAGSLGLSVLFTGTGEAEEATKRSRPITGSASTSGASGAADSSRWMMRDEGLTAPPPAAGPQIDTALEAPPAGATPAGPLVDDLDEEEDLDF